MYTRLLFFALATCVWYPRVEGQVSDAVQVGPSSAGAITAGWSTAVYRVKLDIFLPGGDGKPASELIKGVRKLDPLAGEREPRFDVRGSFRASGLVFPNDSEAIYFPAAGVIVLRAPRETVEAFGAILGDWQPEGADCVRHVFSIVEFTANAQAADLAKLSYRELRRRAGATWRELSSLTLVSRSGERASGSQVSNTTGAGPRRPLKENSETEALSLTKQERGLRCVIEPTVGPDFATCDTTMAVSWRVRSGQPAAKIETNLLLHEGKPAVVQVISTSQGGRRTSVCRALIVRVSVSRPLRLGKASR